MNDKFFSFMTGLILGQTLYGWFDLPDWLKVFNFLTLGLLFYILSN